MRFVLEERLDKGGNELHHDTGGSLEKSEAARHIEIASRGDNLVEIKATMTELSEGLGNQNVAKQVGSIAQSLEKEWKMHFAFKERLHMAGNELVCEHGGSLQESHAAKRGEFASHGNNSDEAKA
eukprot:5220643-Karenia_brevis.AAC.1